MSETADLKLYEPFIKATSQSEVGLVKIQSVVNTIIEPLGGRVNRINFRPAMKSERIPKRENDGEFPDKAIEITFPKKSSSESIFADVRISGTFDEKQKNRLIEFLSFAISKCISDEYNSISSHLNKNLTTLLELVDLSNLINQIVSVYNGKFQLDILFNEWESPFCRASSGVEVEPSSAVSKAAEILLKSKDDILIFLDHRALLISNKGVSYSSFIDTEFSSSRPFILAKIEETNRQPSSMRSSRNHRALLFARYKRFIPEFPFGQGVTFYDVQTTRHIVTELTQSVEYIFSKRLQVEINESITHGMISNAEKLIDISKDIDDIYNDLNLLDISRGNVVDSRQIRLDRNLRDLWLRSKDIFLYAADIKAQSMFGEDVSSIVELSNRNTKHFFADVMQVAVNLQHSIRQRYNKSRVDISNLKAARFADIPELKGDSSLLFLVFRNLIDNAIKYGPREPAVTRINFSWFDLGRFIEVYVEDNGIGVLPEEAGKLFRQGYRSPRAVRLMGPLGRGLGLYHCQLVMQQIGGGIKLVGGAGGSRFVVQIPKAF